MAFWIQGTSGFPIDPKDGEFPIDPIEGWLVEQFPEQGIQAPDDQERWLVEQFPEQGIQAPYGGLLEQFPEQGIQAPYGGLVEQFPKQGIRAPYGGLVEQFPEQGMQTLDEQEWDEIHQDNLRLEEEKPWLQELFCNNSAAAATLGKMIYQEEFHQGDHQGAAANISAKKTLSEPAGGSTSAPKTIEIKVELRERLGIKKSQYKFHVNPIDKVSILKALLVNKKAQLPEGYLFAYRMTIVNEDKSFLDQGMVDVGVPKLDVLDNVANFSPHMDSVSNISRH